MMLFKSSIAFFPAIIASGFLLLSWLMINVDFSSYGKEIKLKLPWLSLKDASTARVIISTIVGGILSLTVFSFSMVMIVLNQAASQMSNRMLSSMIENRFQQIVLGCYIGSIVYALFLLSTIRNIHSGIYVPALSIYLLILLTVIDIFLFIYFLDYVTQSVKYGTIINRVKAKTFHSMRELFKAKEPGTFKNEAEYIQVIGSPVNGYFQGFNQKRLINLVQKQNIAVHFLYPYGTFLLEGTPFFGIEGENVDEKKLDLLLNSIDFFDGQPIDIQPAYGFRHLTEVAIRALSPGINDPATGVLCLNALSELFAFRFFNHPVVSLRDVNNIERVTIATISPVELWNNCIDPIWQYGKEDIIVQRAIKQILNQLIKLPLPEIYHTLLTRQMELVN